MELPLSAYSNIVKKVNTNVADMAIIVTFIGSNQPRKLLSCYSRVQLDGIHVAYMGHTCGMHARTHAQKMKQLPRVPSTLHQGDKCQQLELHLNAFCNGVLLFFASVHYV